MVRNKFHILIILLFGYNFLTAQESYSNHYLRKIAESKPQSKYDSLMSHGAAFSLKDTTKALTFFVEAFNIALQENDIHKRIMTNIACGEMFIEKGAVRKAFGYFFRSRNLLGDITADYKGGIPGQ